jgi:hypothetical protein
MNFIKDLYKLNPVKKYSQNGEEGYIGFILEHIQHNNFLVDIGAGDGYHLSNSRYFIEKGYKAILIEASQNPNLSIINQKVTVENIKGILEAHLCPKSFSFLSIDIDGNDYWIIQEILTYYRPALIVAEFNAFLEKGQSLTIKYDREFTWAGDTYFGFTLEAIEKLAKENGYTAIFQNDNMNVYLLDNQFVSGQTVPKLDYVKQTYFEQTIRTDWVKV